MCGGNLLSRRGPTPGNCQSFFFVGGGGVRPLRPLPMLQDCFMDENIGFRHEHPKRDHLQHSYPFRRDDEHPVVFI